MNILFTSDLSGMGGGETSLINLCSVLQKKNKIIVLCAVEGKLITLLKKKGIKTYILDYRNKLKLAKNILKIRKIVKDERIKIIHSNDPLTSIIMHYAVVGLNVNTYWTCHGQWYDFKGIKKRLIKYSNKHIFCVSTAVKNSLIRMGFDRVSVTYLGIPIEKYENASSSRLREKYNISNKTILIACIGRFQPIKGQLKLVQALDKLIKKNYNIACLLVGGCIFNNDEESKYLNVVEDFVTSNGLSESIFFLGERDDVPNILKEIDILVVPSDNESFGMIAIEALSAGTPVLSTPNDGVSEILEYKNEYIASRNDAQGLQQLIENYLSNKKNKSLASQFCERRKKDFEICLIAQKYMSIFSRGV